MFQRLSAFLITIMLGLPTFAAADTVTVFAAASTKPALDALAPTMKEHGITLRTVFAGSSALARQIDAGAPADIFISANTAWMDRLDKDNRLAPATRTNIATNELVLIARRDLDTPRMVIGPAYPLAALLADGRLAIADPDHVPAGIYGQEALQSLRLWDQVKDRLAPAQDVTGALMYVARGEARLGIVYASDVIRLPMLHILARFPDESHTAIVYPAAIINGRDTPATRQVLSILSGPKGRAAFQFSGFAPPARVNP